MNAVDTNILIYSCDGRDPASQARAREVMSSLTQPVLLWQVACEFIAASRKLADHGFTQEAAWAAPASPSGMRCSLRPALTPA